MIKIRNKETEPITYIQLEEMTYGIGVGAYDENNNLLGYLVRFNWNGTMTRLRNKNSLKMINLQTDAKGRIILDEEDEIHN